MTWELLEDEPETTFEPIQQNEFKYELVPDEESSGELEKPEKKSFNWFEQNFTQEGQQAKAKENREFLKSMVSGASAGWSEYFDPLKVDYESPGTSLGYFTGAALPISLTYKGIGLGFNVLNNLFKLGPKAKVGLDLAHQALTGAAYSTEKELGNVAKGGEFDPYAPAKEAAEFAAFGALLHGLVKFSPKIQNFFKSFTSNQAEELMQGVLPDNLTPNQYKFWQDEVAPEFISNAEKQYAEAVKEANKAADIKFEQDKSIARANHEKELYEASQFNRMTNEQYQKSVAKYQEDLKLAAEEHQAKVDQINRENEIALKEFEEAYKNYQQMRTRQAAVENATRLRPGEETLPYRESPSNIENPSLENEVGNLISKNEAVNSTNAGKSNIEAVRANDAVDYANVNRAYKEAEEAAKGVSSIHQNLVNQLLNTERELTSLAHLSPPQAQRLKAVQDILKKLASFDEAANVTGFFDVSNQFLHDQAKELRYVMDFTFEHGNTKGIFGQTVRQLEEAAEFAARSVGNLEAVEKNINARKLYREWSNDYNNDYIRPYRDNGNQDYSGMFKRAVNSTDEFNALNNILSRSNAGQQLSSVTRRAAVESRLGKFLDNPHSANGRDFEIALRELGAVINPEEANAIRNAFNKARNSPEPIKKPPQFPKFKEIPKEGFYEFSGREPIQKKVDSAQIAQRKVVETPEMKIAAKEMKKTPEEIRKLSETPSGLKKLKENTSKDVFKKIGQQKMREILYEGKITKDITGKDLFKTINKGENYEMISEILGETEARELLDASKELSDRQFTKENILKYIKKVSFLKSLVAIGVL